MPLHADHMPRENGELEDLAVGNECFHPSLLSVRDKNMPAWESLQMKYARPVNLVLKIIYF